MKMRRGAQHRPPPSMRILRFVGEGDHSNIRGPEAWVGLVDRGWHPSPPPPPPFYMSNIG